MIDFSEAQPFGEFGMAILHCVSCPTSLVKPLCHVCTSPICLEERLRFGPVIYLSPIGNGPSNGEQPCYVSCCFLEIWTEQSL